MDLLLTTLQTVLWMAVALGILVFVHEMGHFLAARLFKMRVDAFSLGFPPNLVSRTVGGTEYRIGAVPLGGYVKIAGMVDESFDVDGVESEPAPDEYRAKPVWQRAVVISAGVVFNIVFAVLVFGALAWAYGQSYTPAENVPFEVVPGSVAAEMGLETGDRIVGVNGEPVARFEDVFTPRTVSADAFELTVLRDGRRVELTSGDGFVTRLTRNVNAAEKAGEPATLDRAFGIALQFPAVVGSVGPGSAADQAGIQPGDRILSIGGQPASTWDRLIDQVMASQGRPVTVVWARPDSLGPATAEVVEKRGAATVYQAEVAPRASGDRYQLGVGLDDAAVGQRIDQLGIGQALAVGARETWGQVSGTFAFLGKMVSGRESVRENVSGPLGIAKASKDAADRGARSFWVFVGSISIALAVFNILPIPALDGGHLVFLAYEGIVRREPSLKVRLVVQQVGVALILALMVFVIFNDAVRLFG